MKNLIIIGLVALLALSFAPATSYESHEMGPGPLSESNTI